ncbi:uncharacterized protein Z518_05999 [Rhinocladiella mackenziei CBS 650.93]|uniref:C2H2-type domain-containing protein n=1 Tax=Rhinocladiella mackenziei CBS 650.93 TaxID=1442369 RepID=A0A0D2FSM3_9EURO|nr:uncharacterized protein Z518_05999 [Rhinocladiella mackenziei CBS 650.93]KIX05127.1 hypothetical protein Z518_05999 [Rhinocladiella mackenziei CBS 650.93]
MSQAPDQYFDFERDILKRSPQLAPVKPNFKSSETPPPLIACDQSSDSTDAEETDEPRLSKRRNNRKSRSSPSLGDGVLIRSLDPNQVELATYSEKNPPPLLSDHEEEDDETEAGRHLSKPGGTLAQRQLPNASAQTRDRDVSALEAPYNREGSDFPMIDTPQSWDDEESVPPSAISQNVSQTSFPNRHPDATTPKSQDLSKTIYNTRPPARSAPRMEGLRLQLEPGRDAEHPMLMSPVLDKFTIAPTDPDPDMILPTIQKSPPQSSPAGSLEQRQTLPSLRTTIGQFHDSGSNRYASLSPILGRPSPNQLSHSGPSLCSYHSPQPVMSPPGPPSFINWRNTTRDSSMSTSSEYTPANSAAASTPASSLTAPSPAASNPPLLTAVPEHVIETVQEESIVVKTEPESCNQQPGPKQEPEPDTEPESESEPELEPEPKPRPKPPAALHSMSTRVATGNYKCTFQGCNASPFQTQYLLNSHMNVHSDTRTHFCPVSGCPRGPGGQGFKRKNEMLRHGLVHTSPGYICPFCPDQRHKYPRPDNLQRHVRAHHKDRDRDDPVLREVLNQRMEGSNRLPRRRMRS